jgi:hypothetical protein
MDRALRTLRAPTETAVFPPKTEEMAPITAREWLARADAYVDAAQEDCNGRDDVLEYLKQHRDKISAQYAARVAAESNIALPARFKQLPEIFLNGNVRFPRIRLFLARFIGDRAWRGWVGL